MKKDIVAALRESVGQTDVPPPPQIHAVQRPPKNGARKDTRNKSPGAKFLFKGCWHCGKEEPRHNRSTCPLFEAVLKKANPGISDRKQMKLPEGYKGAYERAREAAGLTNKKKRVNMLDDEDQEDSDSDFENDFPLPGRLCALRDVPSYKDALIGPIAKPVTEPVTDKNRFQALAEEDVEGLPQDTIDNLNGWAVKVNRKSERLQKKSRKQADTEEFTIHSERALDELLSRYPHIAAIPGSDKKIRKILRNMPAELVCRKGEVLCLVDSGSTINAAWIEKHFAEYAHLIQKTSASMRGDTATTAGGQKMVNKGR